MTDQSGRVHFQSRRQFHDFKISNPSGSAFDLCKSFTAQIPARNIQLCNELRLRELFFQTQFPYNGANNVSWRFQFT